MCEVTFSLPNFTLQSIRDADRFRTSFLLLFLKFPRTDTACSQKDETRNALRNDNQNLEWFKSTFLFR